MTPSNAPLSADTDDDTSRQTTLQTIALVIALAATALTPLVWLGTANPPEVLAPALIGITGWVSLFMLRKGYTRYMPHTIVFSVVPAAFIASSDLSFSSLAIWLAYAVDSASALSSWVRTSAGRPSQNFLLTITA